jgi:hypothetical protein
VLDCWSELDNIVACVDDGLERLILARFLEWVVQVVDTQTLAAIAATVDDQVVRLLAEVVVPSVPARFTPKPAGFVSFEASLVK